MMTALWDWQRVTPSASGWYAVQWWPQAPVERVLIRRYVPQWDDPVDELASGELDFCSWQYAWGKNPLLLDPREEAANGSLWRYLGPRWLCNAPQP